ncbi:MAG: undecaprenyl-phosphate glucose phosphotransferase [Gammaproteobacteria bacterium]|nr:undecaprenyl-phosphate glucose phosphotransferase [Gammaproteobacteria bacterium]
MTNSRVPLSFFQRPSSVSASEPPGLFVAKALIHPIIPVAMLGITLLLWGEPIEGHYFLVAVLAFVGAGEVLDVVSIDAPRAVTSVLASLADIVARWLVLIVFIWALLEIVGFAQRFNWHVLLTWAISTPAVLWFSHLLMPSLLQRLRSKRSSRRRVVIAGATELGIRLADRIAAAPWLGTEVVGYFDDRAPARLPLRCRQQLLGKLSDVSAYVAQHGIDTVYITLPMVRHRRVQELLTSLGDSTSSIYFVPDLTVCDLVQPRFDLVNGIPVVAVCESPFYGGRGIAKRLCDILIASVLIVLTAPVMLLVAAAIKCTSPGPVIFRQKRYGLDGKEIIVYKFRSMRVTEDGHTTYKQVERNDARVTPVGAFIRATSLDELPQLFNVLEGSMSIVGPRPHAIAVNEQYRRLIPGYMVRHKVKPGITGWAQVNGYRGGDDLESMRRRIELDLEYLQHWSLMFDFMIILRTAMIFWKDRNAY